MRSRPEAALLLLLALAGPAAAAEPPTREQVQQAVAAVRADPDLAETQKGHELRRKHPPKPEEQRREPPPSWLLALGRWLSGTGRALVWAMGIILAAFVLVSLRHWLRWRAEGDSGRAVALPSHVRELDIRPDSLPDDIGGAARALWQRGEARAALSLLYRGALSRLVHAHAVPIRAASTEGDCVRLARRALPAEGAAFFARLVAAWQTLVYAARQPEEAGVLTLCEQFDAHFGAARVEAAR